MAIFEEVGLTWKGEEHIVPPEKVMLLIAEVEEKITLAELTRKSGPPLAKSAVGFATALRFAGCEVNDDEVYQALFGSGGENVTLVVTALLSMMVPPTDLATSAPSDSEKKSQKK